MVSKFDIIIITLLPRTVEKNREINGEKTRSVVVQTAKRV